MKHIVLTIIMLLLALAGGFLIGGGDRYFGKVTELPITTAEAIAILEYARDAHQVFVDNPELIRREPIDTGDMLYNSIWAYRYQRIIELIKVIEER